VSFITEKIAKEFYVLSQKEKIAALETQNAMKVKKKHEVIEKAVRHHVILRYILQTSRREENSLNLIMKGILYSLV
jgi:hypothetical protein